MSDLRIQPLGEPPDFDLETFNAASPAKLPILLLNASDLSTGHGWRFEAVYMGELDVHDPGDENPEQPNVYDAARDEVDKNTTLARTPWSQIPRTRPVPLSKLKYAEIESCAGSSFIVSGSPKWRFT